MLVGVDAPDAQAVALLPRNVRQQALHAAGGTGSRAREEDQRRSRVVTHYLELLPGSAGSKRAVLHWPRMHEVWRISIATGAGAALGIAAAALLARSRARRASQPRWSALVAGAVLGLARLRLEGGDRRRRSEARSAATAQASFARGAVRRGGTAGRHGVLLVGAAVLGVSRSR